MSLRVALCSSLQSAPRAMRQFALYALVAGALTLALTTCSSAALRAAGEPRGVAFALAHCFFLSTFFGQLSAYMAPTPALTLQMLAGVLVENIPGTREAIGEAITTDASALMRKFALGCILARAGLATDAASAWANRANVAKLSCVGMIEMTTVAGLFIALFSLDAATAFAGGFLMAGISLAVVIPPVAEFQRRGLGVEQGVPALIISASSFDGIIAIVGFGICSGIVAAGGGSGATAMAWKVPTQIVVGGVGGPALAKALVRANILSSSTKPSTGVIDASLVLSTVMVILYSATHLEVSGGGALMAIAFCASLAMEWTNSGCSDALRDASVALTTLWSDFTAPLLFVIIGATLDLHSSSFWNVAPKALAIIVVGGAARAAGVFAATHGNETMSIRDRTFIAFAWTPKATIQAALAGVIYDQAVTAYGADSTQADDGTVLLQTALLSILLTAPLGAWCIAYFAPKLLTQKQAGAI